MQQEKIRRRRENKTRGEVVSSVNRNVKRIPSPTCCSFLLLSTINNSPRLGRTWLETGATRCLVHQDTAAFPPSSSSCLLCHHHQNGISKREREGEECVCMCTVHTQTSLFVRYKSRVQVFPSPDSPVTKRILRPKRNNFGWRTADNNKKKRPTQRIFAYL